MISRRKRLGGTLSLLGAAANGRFARWAGLISVVAVGGFAVVLVVQTVLGWLGVR